MKRSEIIGHATMDNGPEPPSKAALVSITLEFSDRLKRRNPAFLQDFVFRWCWNTLLFHPEQQQRFVNLLKFLPSFLWDLFQLKVTDHAGTSGPHGLGLRWQVGLFVWFHCSFTLLFRSQVIHWLSFSRARRLIPLKHLVSRHPT